MPVPSALLIMSNPDAKDGNAGSAFEIVNAQPTDKDNDKESGDGAPVRNTSGEATVTGEAIKAAYEASRNGNPKAFADAFEGAVKSMIGDEINKVLNERDAQKGY